MKNHLLLIIVMLGFYLNLYSYDTTMISIHQPTLFEANQGEFEVAHRFLGPVDGSKDSRFGIRDGANVFLSYRHVVFDRLQLYTSVNFLQDELSAGAAYTFEHKKLYMRTHIGSHYFSYEKSGVDERRSNVFSYVTLSTTPLFNRLILSFSTSWDGYNEHASVAAGVSMTVLDNVHLIGEFYPQFYDGSDSPYVLDTSVFSCGLKMDTWGHHFFIFVSNSNQIGQRRNALGVDENELHLGFKIQRNFDMN